MYLKQGFYLMLWLSIFSGFLNMIYEMIFQLYI